MHSLFPGPLFLHGFWSSEKAKKNTHFCFIRVIFLQKREVFGYFGLSFQIFYVFNKQNPTYLEFYTKSVTGDPGFILSHCRTLVITEIR